MTLNLQKLVAIQLVKQDRLHNLKNKKKYELFEIHYEDITQSIIDAKNAKELKKLMNYFKLDCFNILDMY